MNSKQLLAIILWGCMASAHAELSPLADEEIGQVTGAGGVYFSGELSINPEGGPLWQSSNPSGPMYRNCASSTDGKCGLRLAIKPNATGGWYVIDNLRGTFSFEGLTLSVRKIDSGFGVEGALFDQNVLSIGLPNEIRMSKVNFTVGVSSSGEWLSAASNPSFKQTDMFGIGIDGTVRMHGNVVIFPTN